MSPTVLRERNKKESSRVSLASETLCPGTNIFPSRKWDQTTFSSPPNGTNIFPSWKWRFCLELFLTTVPSCFQLVLRPSGNCSGSKRSGFTTKIFFRTYMCGGGKLNAMAQHFSLSMLNSDFVESKSRDGALQISIASLRLRRKLCMRYRKSTR